jgi:hypothetical protein
MATAEILEPQELILSTVTTVGDPENRIPYLTPDTLKSFTDVRIVSTDRFVFRLNRAILASMSQFLRDVILDQDDRNEAEELVFLTEISADHLKFILGFFLNGYLPRDISNDLESSFQSVGVDLTKINLEIAAGLPPITTENVEITNLTPDGEFVPPITGIHVDDEAEYYEEDSIVAQPPIKRERRDFMEDVENLPAKRKRKPTVKAGKRKRGRPPGGGYSAYKPRAGTIDNGTKGERASTRKRKTPTAEGDYVKLEPLDEDALDDLLYNEEGGSEDDYNPEDDADDDSDVDGTKDPNRKKECETCKISFELPKYKMHMHKHRRNKAFKSKYVCQICKKRFTTKAMKNEHIETEHATQKYSCEFCLKDYTGVQHAEYCKHVYWHKKTRGTTCVACGNQYRKVQGLDVHLKNMGKYHDNACARCKTVRFSTWNEHAEHVAKEHEGVWHYKCGHCAEIFEVEQVYKDHLRDTHPHEKEICTICGGQYVQMFYHMKEKHSSEAVSGPNLYTFCLRLTTK